MKTRTKIFKANIIVTALLCVALAFGLAFGCLSFSRATAEDAPQPWEVNGWHQYAGTSVSESKDGMVMGNGSDTAYKFSNTTKKSYPLQELTVSLRVKNHLFEAGKNGALLFVKPFALRSWGTVFSRGRTAAAY